jgi:hypothetical protein
MVNTPVTNALVFLLRLMVTQPGREVAAAAVTAAFRLSGLVGTVAARLGGGAMLSSLGFGSWWWQSFGVRAGTN